MELNNPAASMLHMAKCPLVSVESVTQVAVETAHAADRRPVLILRKSAAPRTNRSGRATRGASLRRSYIESEASWPGNFAPPDLIVQGQRVAAEAFL